jgi:integrase
VFSEAKGTKTPIRPLDWHFASTLGHHPHWPSPCPTSGCAGTRSTAYFALKSLYNYLVGTGEVPTNPADKLKISHAHQLRTGVYTDAKAEQILTWARNQDGRRWEVGHTLLATLRFTGLRLNELVNLRLDQVNLDARRFSLVGKGNKPRMVPVPPTLAPVLRSYLEDVGPALPNSPYFFANPGSDPDHQFHGRFGPRAVHQLVRQVGKGAGVPGRHFAHRWRHTYATSLPGTERTSMWPSVCSARPTSPPPSGTCTCPTPT